MCWAVLASLAAHGVLGWLVFSERAGRLTVGPEAAPPDTVEVSFEVKDGTEEAGEAGEEAASLEPASEETTPRMGAVSAAREAARATGAILGAAAVPEGQRVTDASREEGAIAELRSSGTPAAGEVDRLSTFRPLRPDLLGPVRPPPTLEKPRDLLTSPLAKGKAAPRDLPRVLHGSGGVTARVGEDGRLQFAGPRDLSMDKPDFQKVGEGAGAGVSGSFDVTDQAMKLAGQDPYASAKRALADETREARLCIARRYQGERKKQELFHLATNVRRLAARADLSLAARRALIFDIWDECAEESESGPDYGAMARATILAVVREVFPAGSERAYQPGELLALNHRRTSRRRFAPYDPIAAETKRGREPDAGAPGECPIE